MGSPPRRNGGGNRPQDRQRPGGQWQGSGGPPSVAAEPDPPLPQSIVNAWTVVRRGRGPSNPGLVFDRYTPRWDEPASRSGPQPKQIGLNWVRESAQRADDRLLAAWRVRWLEDARLIGAEPFTLVTDWRLITGLGRKGPLEVGFTFHRYGFPVLPASGIKGLARTAGLVAVMDALPAENVKKLDEALSTADAKEYEQKLKALCSAPSDEGRRLALSFRAVFGTTDHAGQAVFLDAIPVRRPMLDLDIMNPHVPAYYRGEQPPTNWQSPTPVFFLTVAAGTEFSFAVGMRGARPQGETETEPTGERRRLQQLALAWLRIGLLEYGAGAKTSAGYGFFRDSVTPEQVGSSEPSLHVGEDQPTRSAGTFAFRGTTSTALPPEAPPPPAPELVWRAGKISAIQMQAGRGRGEVRDGETGQIAGFRDVEITPRGWNPARNANVRYAYAADDERRRIVRIERDNVE